MLGLRCGYRVDRIVSNGASPCARSGIAVHARTVGEDGVARIIDPDGIVNTNRVLGVPGRIGPLRERNFTEARVIIWLIRVTNRTRGNTTDQVA